MGEPLRRTATAIADIVVGDLSRKDLLPESTVCKIEQEIRAAVADRDKEWRAQLGVPLGADEGPVYCWEPSCVAEEARRLAVAAATERAEEVDPDTVACPSCNEGIGDDCCDARNKPMRGIFHVARWRAAIRNQPEGSDGQGGER